MIRLPVTDPEVLQKSAEAIRRGDMIVYPTDTLYGLGADAASEEAVARVERAKGRGGPWSIAVADLAMVEEFAIVPERWRQFVQKNLPGPVTVILQARPGRLAKALLGEGGNVGVRVPDHLFCRALLSSLRIPITSTSVNRTGDPPLNDPKAIELEFAREVSFLVDVGTLPPSQGSAIYDLTGDEIRRLR